MVKSVTAIIWRFREEM